MFYKNNNVLGITLAVECLDFLGKDPQCSCSYIILPMFETDGGKYCILGYSPLHCLQFLMWHSLQLLLVGSRSNQTDRVIN